MGKVIFRFYEELNGHLPAGKRKKNIAVALKEKVSVGKMIRDLGVPLEEVDLILINSVSADPADLLNDGDRVSVYPVFESFDISGVSRVRSKPLRKTAFLLYGDLEPLADALYKRGYDVVMAAGISETDLARQAEKEKRIVITPDRLFSERVSISRILCIPTDSVEKQVQYIADRLNLENRDRKHHDR